MSSEDMHPRPLSPYAASKLSAEHSCTVWSELDKLSTVSLRYFNVFGPGQNADSKYAAVFPAFVTSLLRGEAPVIHWDGEQSRDFTFIDDVVTANLKAAEADGRVDGKVINVAGGTPRSINETYETIRRILDVDIQPERTPRREGDIRVSRRNSWGGRSRRLGRTPSARQCLGSRSARCRMPDAGPSQAEERVSSLKQSDD